MEAAEQLVVNRWLAAVDEHKASDLILSVGNPPTLRIQGKLFPLPNEGLLVPDFMRRLSETWLTPEQLKQLEDKRQIAFGLTMANRRRFKIDTFYQSGFVSIALRMVPERIPNWEQIGLPPSALSLAEAERGLLMVCGPFGSGRSTTVAAIVNHINRLKTKHVVTFEDPIEYQYADDHSIIEQRELGTDVPDMIKALEALMNEDVDVVVLALNNQPSVTQKMMDLVSSGRLVILLANAHTTAQALERLVQSFPPAEQPTAHLILSAGLVGVINQRLIPTLGGGQALVADVLLPTERVKEVLRTGELDRLTQLLQTDQAEGLVSLDQGLANLVRNGDMTRDVAMSFALDQTALNSFVTGAQRLV